MIVANSNLILYGNSVFLAGIKTELERDATLDLITVEAGCPDVIDLVRVHKPCSLLFDLTMGQLDFAVTLLRAHPGLLLIGVDPSSDDLLILSSQSVKSLSYLIKIIRQKDKTSERQIENI